MFETSQEANCQNELTLWPGDTHASHSVTPGSAEARKMTASSGRKCAELLTKRDPIGLLARTLLGMSAWDSTKCWLTWKALATPRYRLLFRLQASVHGTCAIDVGLLPTPDASMGSGGRTCGGHVTNSGRCTRTGKKRSMTFADGCKRLGLPMTPEFAEAVMGFPIGWTDLNHSETP